MEEDDLSDRAILDIADGIGTSDKVKRLGVALGFDHPAIRRFIDTNTMHGRITTVGTRDMLHAWKERTSPAKHRELMQRALHESGLQQLGHNILGPLPSRSDGKSPFVASMILSCLN